MEEKNNHSLTLCSLTKALINFLTIYSIFFYRGESGESDESADTDASDEAIESDESDESGDSNDSDSEEYILFLFYSQIHLCNTVKLRQYN